MVTQTGAILAAILVVFIITSIFFKMPTELSMIIAALVGALVGGYGLPLRQMVEGSYTYLDIILVIISATIFMNILMESGAIYSIVRSMVKKFYKSRCILLILLMLVLILPGALTGAGGVSVLVSGGIVSMVLGYMGISRLNVAVIVYIGAVLGIAAPPVNIIAMIISTGVTMPYIGFFIPLIVPILILGIFSVLFLGWKGKSLELNDIINRLPQVSPKMTGLRVYLPLLALALLMLSTKLFPHALPILGLPLIFIISSVFALLLSRGIGKKINIILISKKTIKQLFSIIATLIAVGILVQILTLTGIRGLLIITIVTLPLWLVYIGGLAIALPIGEGIFLYGVAAVLGVPLAFLFINSVGLDPILVTAGISLICPLGDALPPSRIIGRLTVETVNYNGSYMSFLKRTIVPWLAITIAGMVLVIFSDSLKFLLI